MSFSFLKMILLLSNQCHATAVKEMSSDEQTIPSTVTISLVFVSNCKMYLSQISKCICLMSSDEQTIPSTATISLLFSTERNLMAASSTRSSDTRNILWFSSSRDLAGLATFHLFHVSPCQKKITFHALQIKKVLLFCLLYFKIRGRL